MADMQVSRNASSASRGPATAIAKITGIAGALVSVALLVGIGKWGYDIVVRDVSGVPVVRALEGPMRETPIEPGGREAAHQGLSVNRVAAQGATAAPPEQVVIAPAPLDLTREDVPQAHTAAARSNNRAHSSGDVHLAMARQPAEAGAGPDIASEGGLGRSLRPRLRPALPDPVAYALAAATDTAPREVDPDTLPEGTRLAQLGAFTSADVARDEWDRLSVRLGDLLDGKRRVVQRAESGGRTFYRLRATGFEDLADARRFCSALQAEDTECIPVVAR